MGEGRGREGGRASRARRATAPRAPPDVAMMQHSPSGAESQHAAAASRVSSAARATRCAGTKATPAGAEEAAPAVEGGAEGQGQGEGVSTCSRARNGRCPGDAAADFHIPDAFLIIANIIQFGEKVPLMRRGRRTGSRRPARAAGGHLRRRRSRIAKGQKGLKGFRFSNHAYFSPHTVTSFYAFLYISI